MTPDALPTSLETALGGLLQDIGKFMQRAHGAARHDHEIGALRGKPCRRTAATRATLSTPGD